ncbi:MAG: hypothetical protein NXI20_17905 [bacterium]|nr:hypothetical protein [bacterium]
MKLSLNDQVIFYPNGKGIEKMHSILTDQFEMSDHEAKEWMEERMTDDGGYFEQLHEVINVFHSMFYNGTPYFENVEFKLYHN